MSRICWVCLKAFRLMSSWSSVLVVRWKFWWIIDLVGWAGTGHCLRSDEEERDASLGPGSSFQIYLPVTPHYYSQPVHHSNSTTVSNSRRETVQSNSPFPAELPVIHHSIPLFLLETRDLSENVENTFCEVISGLSSQCWQKYHTEVISDKIGFDSQTNCLA